MEKLVVTFFPEGSLKGILKNVFYFKNALHLNCLGQVFLLHCMFIYVNL